MKSGNFRPLLELNIGEFLIKVGKLTGVKFPRSIIKVGLEPKLNMVCIRFKKLGKMEFGETYTPWNTLVLG